MAFPAASACARSSIRKGKYGSICDAVAKAATTDVTAHVAEDIVAAAADVTAAERVDTENKLQLHLSIQTEALGLHDTDKISKL